MSTQTNNDFEKFCKEQISFLNLVVENKHSQHEEKVNFNKEHADDIMDDLRAGGSWMLSDEPTPEHWYPEEQDDLFAISHGKMLAHKWKTVLQEVINRSLQLDISEMDLISFPIDICKLSYLTSLNVSGNKLSVLPKEIAALVNITKLDLSNNQLVSLPPELGKFSNLTHLNLSDNKLSVLPRNIAKLSHLISLDVSRNKFALPPDEVRELGNLKTLKMRLMSPNTNILTEIIKLKNLQELDVSGNNLAELSNDISKLTQLVSLNLSNNQLTTLPPTIVQLANLKYLNIRENNIPLSSYSSWIGKLKNIEEFIGSKGKQT